MKSFKSLILAAIMILPTMAIATSPVLANEYPKLLKPVSVNYVNANGAGLSYGLATWNLTSLAKTPITLKFAPGIETDPNHNWQVSENLGAYVGVGQLEAGVTKTFSRGFNLGKPLEFSVGFALFKN